LAITLPTSGGRSVGIVRSRTQTIEFFFYDSTDASDTSQLAIFIRGVEADFIITEELLTLQPLKGTITGEDIFETVNTLFERFWLEWSSLSGICIDGALAMVGARKGLIESIKFTKVMEVVVASITYIKSRAHNHLQFKGYLADLFSEYEDVSYCEVRWLSKSQTLKRFYGLRQDIADFMDIKGNTINQVKDGEWVCDLAFLVDVTGYLNELNLKLQKQGQLVHELQGQVKTFVIN
jgi:hypothetical protein